MSDSARVLEALRSGPKTASELYRLHCIVHSRVADLRRKGHIITCAKLSGNGAKTYVYTLVTEAAPSEPESFGGNGSPLFAQSVTADGACSGSLSADEQLSLVTA